MLRYLYIPENEDLDVHIEFAVENKFNQIIHGESEIIKNLVSDLNSIKEINLPEYRTLENDFLVFQENKTFNITFIDEYLINSNYEISRIDIYRIDDNDFNKKEFIQSYKMYKIGDFVYSSEIRLSNYGEYSFSIISTDENSEKTILEDKIIIYKEYIEQEDIRDKFFFEV